MSRLPSWIRLSLCTDQGFNHVHSLISSHKLNTVCESAKCPNRHACWNRGTATMMILGDVCTRDCKFCAIKTGRPLPLDYDEPRRVASAAKSMNLNHVVITSVARDDLDDGGAGIFAETISAIRDELPEASIEVLTPDFDSKIENLDQVLKARPDVFNHNLETVKRFQPLIRPQASYGRSLATLKHAASSPIRPAIKSGMMLGLGETEEEIVEAMGDLVSVGCELLTLGQYLRPTPDHIKVNRYVAPDEFNHFADRAREIGFKGVASGPMVRSSYKADELLAQLRS
ncbi:MAG: lipoyl synthase [Kiritimatiellae bacterium]|nr:lipoyl synthase [Kiritimatiellia bacterium]